MNRKVRSIVSKITDPFTQFLVVTSKRYDGESCPFEHVRVGSAFLSAQRAPRGCTFELEGSGNEKARPTLLQCLDMVCPQLEGPMTIHKAGISDCKEDSRGQLFERESVCSSRRWRRVEIHCEHRHSA